MADFKTTLERLARGEVEFESVAKNVDKLLRKKPQAAVAVLDQLKQAVTDDLIDAETYARLKSRIAGHVEAAPVGDDARTEFAGGAADATQVLEGGGDEATEFLDVTGADTQAPESGGGTTGIDFDLTGESGPSDPSTGSSWPTGDSQTGQTGTDWAQPGESAGATKIAPGAVLRGRFQLDEVLGVGGMGSVYLGSDLIKVRAQDKQPRVALKVLNEDFKQHPDSFIALQREASRQQKLAHPNIATVYDFDQTEDGLAFLVMELLEGQPLNDFIKKVVRPKGGLPFEEAFPMVEGLGNALIYAHERNIVHSDFKPGNCFITKDGNMKVLDFGIARAVKNPGAAEGETTIFDPGKLGALTPAYASTEMLEGEEPDTRDDIYALACVAYELLTGKHPFNKIPANKARDNNLKPEPIKGLTRKQWRGLERGLAFAREDRSQSTAEFLEEFEGRTSPWKNPFIMVPAAAVLLLLAGFFPVKNYLEEQDILARIDMARSGDPAQIEAVLANMAADGLDPADQNRILTEAQDPILDFFVASARAKVDTDAGNYDFNGAKQIVADAKLYAPYSDSGRLQALEDEIESAEARLFAEQFDKFNAALEEGNLLAVDGENDITDAMEIVRRVDPQHPMLKDPRLPGAFASAINAALENQEFNYADELSTAGLGHIADNVNLLNLSDKIAGARERAETASRILAAIAEIQAARDSGEGLAAYVEVQDSIQDLAALDPANELLAEVRRDVAPRVAQELAALEANRQWGRSDLMAEDFSRGLRALGLHEENARAGTLRAEYNGVVAGLVSEVTSAVAAGDVRDKAARLLAELGKVAPRSERTVDARTQVAKAHLASAQVARDAGDFDAATRALDAAREADPAPRVAALVDEEAATVAADAALDEAARAAARRERQAAFDAAWPAFSTGLAALGDDAQAYEAAFAELDRLRALSPADARLGEAAATLADAVTRGAEQLGAQDEWDAAVALTREAIVNLPRASALGERLVALEAERAEALAEMQRQLVENSKREVEALLEDPVADRAWRASVRQKMADIAALGEPNDPWLAEQGRRIAETYVQRAAEMRTEQRFAEGANLLASAERYAADAPGLAAEREALAAATEAFEREQAEQQRLARIEGLRQTFQSQARANDVVNASKTLESLKAELGGASDAFVDKEAPRLLAGAYFKLATTRAEAGDFSAALRFARACAELAPTRQDCRLAVRDYTVGGHSEDLASTFSRGGEFDVTEVLGKISEVQILDPGVFSSSADEWANAVAARLDALKEAEGTGANDFIEQAKDVFKEHPTIAAIEPVPLTVAPVSNDAAIREALRKAMLSLAREEIQKAESENPAHPDVQTFKARYNAGVREVKELVSSFDGQYREARDLANAGSTQAAFDKGLEAQKTIEQAVGVWSDSAALKKRNNAVLTMLAKLQENLGATTDAGTDKPIIVLPPEATPSPCEAKLAGHGRRKAGTCFDYVSGRQSGPRMVVVPAGGDFAAPFAIGKYEIAKADFYRYCSLSGACEYPKPSKEDARLPATGISYEQARAYVAWLSERTGLNYRLPTAAEWAYAASANGGQPKKDYNCRVEQGGQILKGQGLMGVNTGKANDWGLYNYVGNAQEWVTSGDGVTARGGAFEDAFSKCDISLEKPHDGKADASTGFRVLLELG